MKNIEHEIRWQICNKYKDQIYYRVNNIICCKIDNQARGQIFLQVWRQIQDKIDDQIEKVKL
jgi:hypothetical protein